MISRERIGRGLRGIGSWTRTRGGTIFDAMEIGEDGVHASGSRYRSRFSSRFNHRIGKLDSPGLRIYVSKVRHGHSLGRRRASKRERERDCVTFDRYFSYMRLILRATRGNRTSINRGSWSVDSRITLWFWFFFFFWIWEKNFFAWEMKKEIIM